MAVRLVRVLCSGTTRKRHDARRLDLLADARTDGGAITHAVDVAEAASSGMVTVAKMWRRDPDFLLPDNGVFRWRCPKCGRTPRLREERLGQLIDVFRATRGEDCDFIDVSLVP